MNRKPWLMNTRMKYLDYTLIGILGTLSAGVVLAQETTTEPTTQVQIRAVGEAQSKDDDKSDLQRWLKMGREIQWDYKNIVKRKGRLERLA